MDIEQLIESVKASEATKSNWRNKHDSEEFRNASKLNKLIFDKPLNHAKKCECIEDLFFYLNRKNVKSQIMEKQNKVFVLMSGKLITSFLHETISVHSTDEQCIEALKASPGIIKFFKSYPENWRDICKLPPLDGETKKTESDPSNEETHKVNLEDLKENPGEDLKEGEEIKIPTEENSPTPANEEEAQIETDSAFEIPSNLESMKVAEIKTFLAAKKIDFDSSLKKDELIQFVKGLK